MEFSSSKLLQLLCLIIFGKMLAFGFVGQEERKCKYLRVDKMLKIRCYDMNLKEVPQYLKTSVEVLDLSYNRIKKLKRISFQQYNNIKYLLLYENMIQSVEPGTFQKLTSLQEIDLSNNALLTIPLEIFQLPSLRNLYVDSNELFNLERDLEALDTPINAPLEYLNIADCGLSDLPNLGILPNLWHINASSNPLDDLTVANFANLCNLKSIDLIRTSLAPCTCQQVNNHFRYLGVKTKYVPVCVETLSVDVCPLPYNQTIHSESFQTCKSTKAVAEARSMWLFAAGCLGGVVVVLLLVWFCVHRRRKQRAKRLKAAQSRKHFVISPKNAINNHSPPSPKHNHLRDLHHHHHLQQDDKLLHCDSA